MTSEDTFDNPFCNELDEYLQDYEKHLATKGLTKSTSNKHLSIISFFVESIGYSNLSGFEDITKANLNSKLRAYLKIDRSTEYSNKFISYALKGYFSFIYDKYGISTPLIKSVFTIK